MVVYHRQLLQRLLRDLGMIRWLVSELQRLMQGVVRHGMGAT